MFRRTLDRRRGCGSRTVAPRGVLRLSSTWFRCGVGSTKGAPYDERHDWVGVGLGGEVDVFGIAGVDELSARRAAPDGIPKLVALGVPGGLSRACLGGAFEVGGEGRR